MTLGSGLDEEHQHRFAPAGILLLGNANPITQVVVNRPALVKLCPCGQTETEWVRDPIEPKPLQEDILAELRKDGP